jgi:hypothetical protein
VFGDIDLAPDDRTAFFLGGDSAQSRNRIMALDLISGVTAEVAKLPDTARGIAVRVSPDGETLAVTLARSAAGAADTSEASSTGYLAVVGIGDGRYREVYGPVSGRTMKASERPRPGNITPLLRMSRMGEPRWTRDGRAVLVGILQDDGSWEVNRIDANEAGAQRLGTITSPEIQANGDSAEGFTLSPDGRQIAYGGYTTTRPLNELWTLDFSALLRTPGR